MSLIVRLVRPPTYTFTGRFFAATYALNSFSELFGLMLMSIYPFKIIRKDNEEKKNEEMRKKIENDRSKLKEGPRLFR